MALLEKYTSPLWGIWKIEETEAQETPRKTERYATRLLVKELLGYDTEIAHHPSGAPFLPNEPELCISISHTKGYVAVIFSNQPVGIDIEYKSERIHKIKSRFLSDEEAAVIDAVYQTEHLLIYWCAKETLFKLIGQTDVDFKKHLHVLPFLFAYPTGEFSTAETRTNECTSFRFAYHIADSYVLTLSIPNLPTSESL